MWEVGPGIHHEDPATGRPQTVVALPEATEGPASEHQVSGLGLLRVKAGEGGL